MTGIKPHHVTTYCGCTCVEVDTVGYGTMQLCSMHEQRTHLREGAVLTPQVYVNIPQTLKASIMSRMKWIRRELNEFL